MFGGAKGPDRFDCSGLASWSYAQIGVGIPAGSRGQFGGMRAVDRAALQQGDLIFFDIDRNRQVDHVGLLADVDSDGQWDLIHAARTLERFRLWQPVLRYYHLPAAFVAQDDLETLIAHIPWAQFAALFIGGSTAWKTSSYVRRLADEAKQRGKWIHLGRVKSARRIAYAIALGCDSFDGTGYSRFSRRCIPLAIHTIQRIDAQMTLWERTAR